MGILFPWYERARAQREIASNNDYRFHRYEEGFDPATDSSPVPDWLSGVLDHHHFYDVVDIFVEPSTEENLARMQSLPELESIWFTMGDGATEEGISGLASLTKLRSVKIIDSQHSSRANEKPADLMGIANLTQIEELRVSIPSVFARVEDSVPEIAKLTNLRKLRLALAVEVTDPKVQPLGNLTGLESLYIEWLYFGRNNFDEFNSPPEVSPPSHHFLGKLKQLKELSLHGYSVINGEVLSSLQGLPHLETLIIHLEGRQYTPAAIKNLEKLARLRTLRLHYDPRLVEPPEVSEADLVRLCNKINLREFWFDLHVYQNGSELDQFTTLEHLHIDGGSRLKSESVPLRLNLFKGLKVLEFSDMDSLTDADLAKIAQHGRLKKVHLQKCHNVTEAGIAKLANLKTLTHLEVKYCENVTSADEKSLRAALPKVLIEFKYL
ncbi:MAG: hypothetical protein SGJ20_10110 [Planctomycetota bacterium]|nr:hypothetical protein [Planctomycetota bacterium]